MSASKEINKTVEDRSERVTVAPAVDIFENDQEVLVVADVPGVQSEGLSLSFDKGQLTIEASVKPFEQSGTALFEEYASVDYRRAFHLTPGIDAEKIAAELQSGTLKIHLHKAAALKPRQIPLSSG